MNINNTTTLIILDWDDTLFPTSWISKNNIEFLSNENKDLLYNKFFYKLLNKLRKLEKKSIFLCIQLRIISIQQINFLQILNFLFVSIKIKQTPELQ